MKKRIRLYLQRLIGNRFEGIFSSYLNATHGIELDELRQYQPGDEFRAIDWKTTSRTGKLHVRVKLVDKRVTIIFLIDKSRSQKFGTFKNTKEQIQSFIISTLSFAASETGNEIGFITFTDKVEKYIQPKTGEKEALKNIQNILHDKPSSNFTDLRIPLTFLSKKITAPSLIFILSDFLAPYNYEHPLRTLSYLHEVIPIVIFDRAEKSIPKIRGFITVQDMETRSIQTLDIRRTLDNPAPCFTLFKKLNLEYISLSSMEDEGIWIKKISEFFDRRIRRGGKIRR